MRATVRVGPKTIGPGHAVFIVAEIGATHGGRLEIALRLVEEAARCGVDAVKLQTIRADESYIPGERSYEIFKHLWLERHELLELKRACEERGLILFTTPGDVAGLELAVEVGLPLLKISSGLMTNLPLIRRAAGTGLPLVISTGMSELEEVTEAVDAATAGGCEQLMLMHCVSLYPAPAAALNLTAMRTLAARFPCPVGYSDHYDGIAACVAATALGARLLEKHFTLDRTTAGPDHAFSADPRQMRELVRLVRETDAMLGDGRKVPAEAERPQRAIYRRCLVARRDIAAGETIGPEAIGLKRPRGGRQGLPPASLEAVLGCRAARPIAQHESLTSDMLTAPLTQPAPMVR